MKLLFFVRRINNGGVGRVTANLASRLSERGHAVTLVTEIKDLPAHEYALSPGIRRINLEYGDKATAISKFIKKYRRLRAPAKEARKVRLLRGILRAERPDALLAFLPKQVLPARLASLFLRIPLIASVRSIDHTSPRMRLLYALSDGCVFQTPEAMRRFPRSLQRRSTILANVINPVFFNTPRDGPGRDIICVGRLHPQKNWPLAIDAFSMLANEFEDNLHIYGRGALLEALQAQAARLGLSDRICFTEQAASIELQLASAKMFLMTSDFEGMPNALIEALVLGLPCVSTRFLGGGAEMLIRDGVNGLLVPRGDAAALAQAMRRVLSAPEFAAELGSNARRDAQRFRPGPVVAAWEAYILSVIGRGRRDRRGPPGSHH